MGLLAAALLCQLAGVARESLPVLAFPEAGLDDSAAYAGYQTRIYRDAARNTVQIYLDQRQGRVVHLFADALDASIGFSARDGDDRPASMRWSSAGARLSRTGHVRGLEFQLTADDSLLRLGAFLLGSMRVERDFQYDQRHRAPLGSAPYVPPEFERLVAAVDQLKPPLRERHLSLLAARDLAALRRRLTPEITSPHAGNRWTTRIVQASLDGHDTLSLEFRIDPRRVVATRVGPSLEFRARTGGTVTVAVRVATTGDRLTPLEREQIFTPEFLAFVARARAEGLVAGAPPAAALRARWLERQVRGVEVLASREKLMAGLPTYATYFGRDMLVTALMMRPIWRAEMSEFVVASVLRKLSPDGQVSHEEALGSQAMREAAVEYSELMREYQHATQAGTPAAADSALRRAGAVLGSLSRVRENYHMIDDEYHLPILAARWLHDPRVHAARKRAFLLDSSDGGGTRLARLLRELALVADATAPYTTRPVPSNLVSFPPRIGSGWSSASWRDSNAGYGGGRYPMDVNVIWVPHALEAIGQILDAIRSLGLSASSPVHQAPGQRSAGALARYTGDPATLRSAIATWQGASQHFVVRLSPSQVQQQVSDRLAAVPENERTLWKNVLARSGADRDSLTFLALSLDAEGRPIGIANSDVATRLFLGDREGVSEPPDRRTMEDVRRDVGLFTRAYPAGLLVDGLGPVVANDAYAPPSVWREFERDPYHGTRVAWGREVNLFLLGVANRIAATTVTSGGNAPGSRDPSTVEYVATLRSAIARVRSAVEASGFRSELWSYEVRDGQLRPVRYGSGGDVQLWSTTDLVVQFSLSQLEAAGRR